MLAGAGHVGKGEGGEGYNLCCTLCCALHTLCTLHFFCMAATHPASKGR